LAVPRDAIVGIVLLAIAGIYWLGADAIPRSPLGGGVGAEGLPKALAYALAALSAILIVRSVWAKAAGGEQPLPGEAQGWRGHLRALGILVLGIAYIALLPYLGYALSIILLVGIAAWYNGKPLSWELVATAVVTGIAFYLLFVLFLDIRLPAGFLPDFAELAGFG
jgi:hypothetical protein